MGNPRATLLAVVLAACHPQAAPQVTTPRLAGDIVGILAHFKMLPGKEDAALALFRDTATKVQANEPGVLVYMFFRSKTDPQEIVVYEVYTDAAARKAHIESPVMTETRAKLPEVIDMKSVKLESFDSSVLGFDR